MLSRKQRLMKRRQNEKKERAKNTAARKPEQQKKLKKNDSRINKLAKIKAYEGLCKQLEGYADVNTGVILYGGVKFPYIIRKDSSVLVHYQGEGRDFSLAEPDFRKSLIDFIGGMG